VGGLVSTEHRGIKFNAKTAYSAKATNNNDDWDDTLKQKSSSKSTKKSKRNELSSDEESSNDGGSKRPMANIMKAVDFDSHVYSNNAIMGSNHDVNYDLLNKFKHRDGGAKGYMGLSHHESSLDAKMGGTSKFTSRRYYKETMAPRGTSDAISEKSGQIGTWRC
jgi:hypothetical protein